MSYLSLHYYDEHEKITRVAVTRVQIKNSTPALPKFTTRFLKFLKFLKDYKLHFQIAREIFLLPILIIPINISFFYLKHSVLEAPMFVYQYLYRPI